MCIYCHNYLTNSIDKLTKSYNKRLEMVNDTQDEFEEPENDLIQEDTNQLDNIPVYE